MNTSEVASMMAQIIPAVESILKEGGPSHARQAALSEQEKMDCHALARRHYDDCRYQEALQLFMLLLMEDMCNSKLHLAVGACLKMMNKSTEAIAIYSLAWFFDPDNVKTLFYLGQCLLADGKREDGRDMLQEFVDRAANDSQYAVLAKRAQGLLMTTAGAA